MGHYTYYEITVYDWNQKQMTDDHHKDLINHIYDLYHEAIEAMDEYGVPVQAVKWYDCYDNIKEFSKRFPWLIFQIDAEGESGDESRAYIKNGKIQDCNITTLYEKYDESKLQ